MGVEGAMTHFCDADRPRRRARGLLPDLITLARLPLAAIFPFVAQRPAAAIAVVLSAATTDVADGWCARSLGQVTAIGAALDVVADKAFIGTAVVTLIATRMLTLPAAALLAAREFGEIPLLAYVALRRGAARHERATSSVASKLTTMFQLALVCALLLGWGEWRLLLGAAAACGAVAAVGYWMRELRLASRAVESVDAAGQAPSTIARPRDARRNTGRRAW